MLFRLKPKITNKREIPIGISAVMNVIRCCTLAFISQFRIIISESPSYSPSWEPYIFLRIISKLNLESF